VVVVQVRDIRVPISAMQGLNSTVAIVVVNVVHIHYAEPSTIPTPPRMKVIARPDRKPSEPTPASETYAESKAAAPTEE
jgi:hypothetical protein